MPDLRFAVETMQPLRDAATPTLACRVRVSNMPREEPIHSVALRCQVQIEPARRRYNGDEQSGLSELFGEPARWGSTVHPLLWTNTQATVSAFSGDTSVDLPVPCTFDFNVAATKYFHALYDGEVPLSLLFSGTVFYAGAERPMQMGQIPWDREASYRMPIAVWQKLMEMYYANSAWLALRRDVFERLYRYGVAQGLPTWEEMLERLLDRGESGQ
ncbi:MAG TPA: DUF6084 family protein [Terriglobales bacterium]|nr:DUF6084 family protein [Terriglobales bacterium]